MTEPRKVRRLFWDIEVSPNVVLSWRIGHKIAILPDSILKERAIICIAWKWEGEKEVKTAAWTSEQDDKPVVEAFLKDALEADELVAHNGDRFDVGWLRTRALKHGLGPLPSFKTVDTLAWAKRLCLFNSNKLDYIARFLGVGAKTRTDYDLWKDVLKGDPKALNRMVAYCANDVRVLERVWAKLRDLTEGKTHAGALAGHDKWSCPHCASEKVETNRTSMTAFGTLRFKMRCKSCGRYYTINERAHSAYEKRPAR